MSLVEVATVLGKSERQVRYLIRQGKLKAKKDGKRWRIESDDLPLGEVQRRQLAERLSTAQTQVDAAFAPAKKAIGSSAKTQTDDRYSVRKLMAFEVGRELHLEVITNHGESHPAGAALYESLVRLTQGCHAFRPADKARYFDEARKFAATAAAHLFLIQDGHGEELGARLERELVSKIGGLVASQEKNQKGNNRDKSQSRFDRFGSAGGD